MTPRHWQADDREMEPIRPQPCDDLPLWIVEDTVPYAKHSDTSREAAERMHLAAAQQRRRVLATFRAAGERGLTPDEAAALMEITVLAARPRCTELRQSGFLEYTGEKRTNQSGMRANVLRAVERSESK